MAGMLSAWVVAVVKLTLGIRTCLRGKYLPLLRAYMYPRLWLQMTAVIECVSGSKCEGNPCMNMAGAFAEQCQGT